MADGQSRERDQAERTLRCKGLETNVLTWARPVEFIRGSSLEGGGANGIACGRPVSPTIGSCVPIMALADGPAPRSGHHPRVSPTHSTPRRIPADFCCRCWRCGCIDLIRTGAGISAGLVCHGGFDAVYPVAIARSSIRLPCAEPG